MSRLEAKTYDLKIVWPTNVLTPEEIAVMRKGRATNPLKTLIAGVIGFEKGVQRFEAFYRQAVKSGIQSDKPGFVSSFINIFR